MSHNFVRFNNYLKANKLARNTTGIVVAFILLVLLQLPIRFAYYGLLNGNYFLNVRNAKVIYIDPEEGDSNKIPQNKVADFVFAREPRTRISSFDVVRTYYRTDTGQSVLQRNLPDGIEYEQSIDLDTLPIVQERRPNELGRYRFCQVLSFETQGFTKFADFCTEPFEIVAPVE